MLGRAYNEAEPEITLSCRFPAQMGIKYLLPLTMYGKVKKKWLALPKEKARSGAAPRNTVPEHGNFLHCENKFLKFFRGKDIDVD